MGAGGGHEPTPCRSSGEQMALWSGVLPWDRGAQLKPLEFLSLRFIFNGLMFKMGQEGWIWGNLSDQAMTETLE